MVTTSDIILGSGLLLGVLYLKKRSDQISTIAPDPTYYEQVQKVNLQRLTEFGSRIEQLKDIRNQIFEFEKEKSEEKISFIESEIQKARQAGSAAQAKLARFIPSQPKLGYGPTFLTKSYTGQALANALAARQAQAEAQFQLQQSLSFITAAQAQQAEIRSTYAELEQIV